VQRDGLASPEQVDVCVRALAGVDHRGFDPADLDAADVLLADFAQSFAPKELSRLAQQVVDRIDPDGTRPQEQVNADRRHFAFRRTRDGMYACEGRLTGRVGAKLNAVLGPLAAPRVETVTLGDGREVQNEDRVTTASGCTTPWKRCATGSSAPAPCPTPAAPPPPSSSRSPRPTCRRGAGGA